MDPFCHLRPFRLCCIASSFSRHRHQTRYPQVFQSDRIKARQRLKWESFAGRRVCVLDPIRVRTAAGASFPGRPRIPGLGYSGRVCSIAVVSQAASSRRRVVELLLAVLQMMCALSG
ncbi:hypothetical protein K402DRAFT_140102 [Aulographum hederae CBS 113979]|uniref:Uncharacterized protein n=1 Tax=Aulographum hederae CBS 113979 TaxID=1176131 RepID=A0A6G1GV07_9PEZI|nr:hypothetical protein K402DRAFT_140102 [Aulographum hederae CBS 113979]